MKQDVSILVAGDFCPLFGLERQLVKANISRVFGDFSKELKGTDIAVLNLEAPLTRRRKGVLKRGPNLKLSPRIAPALRKAGFTIACLANNHIRDYGTDGLLDTVNTLNKAKIKSFGIGQNQFKAAKPLSIRRNGLKIAMLAFAENEFGCADNSDWGANPMNPIEDCRAINAAAQKNDVVLVFAHGGNEHCPFPSPRTIKNYRNYALAGATAVIGSHTHVPQGFEIYNESPIFYSLGNFIFPWEPIQKNLFWYRGMAVKLILSQKTVSVKLVPVLANTDGSVSVMKEPELSKFSGYLKELSVLISRPDKLDKMWNAWCAMSASEVWLKPVSSLQWPARSKKQLSALTAIENRVACESHRELGLTFLKLLRDGKIKEAKNSIPVVRKLIKGYL